MKLSEIISNLKVLQTIGDTERNIEGINIDSRLIKENHLFVAIKGTVADGHNYINKERRLFCARIFLQKRQKE